VGQSFPGPVPGPPWSVPSAVAGVRARAEKARQKRVVLVRLVKWLVVAIVVAAGLAFAGWWFLLKSDPAPRAAIIETPTTTPTTAAGATGSPLDGTWTVSPGDSRNFVGYRVTEKLVANVVESTATGRTDNVTGTMTIDGTTVRDVTVTAELRDLTSDQDFRDQRIRSSGLESDKFPEAKFVLTAPITVAAQPAVGDTITVKAAGNFTLHGVTKPVTIDLQARYDGKNVQVVGSLPVVFADYGITAPSSQLVASVDDHGEMELQLFLVKRG